MKKLNYLLHHVTIINFILMGKLVVRYRAVTLLAALAFVIVVPVLYFTQPEVYQKEVTFKVLSTLSLAPGDKNLSGALEALNPNAVMSDVLSMVESYDFKLRLAEKLVQDEAYEKFDFRHPTKGLGPQQEALAGCKEESCRVKLLKEIVPNFYGVNYTALSGRFTLTVTTRSALTTKKILMVFQQALAELRVERTAKEVEKQITQVQGLLMKSKADLEAGGGFEKITSGEFLDAKISQQKDKIRTLANRLISDDNQYFYQRTRLRESSLAAGGSIEGKEKLSYERYSKITKRLEELRQNIASITSVAQELRSETDNLVLAQLKIELETLEKELKSFGKNPATVALTDSFINSHKGNKNSYEFDYKVTSAQVKKLRDEYESAMAELDALYGRKAALENELVALKPDLEYIQLLESKLVSLKYKQSATVSDLSFDQYGGESIAFKRNSFVKIAIFGFLLIGFLLFTVYMVIYIFDDQIFEEMEVHKCIEELPVVGHAPYFE